jgi:heme/copper-type cytochrome/quinol oxidase subunit 2
MADPFTWRGLGPLDLLVKFLDHQVTLEGRIVPLEAWAFADTLIYESIMLQAEDLSFGSFRLLEVDVPLYLPIDVSIRVVVSSDDVLHSWAVPSLGIKIDSVPVDSTLLNLE